MKYIRHHSITAKQDAYKESSFYFSTVEKLDVIREIKNLKIKKKATQDDDFPLKILKENINERNAFAETFAVFTIMNNDL